MPAAPPVVVSVSPGSGASLNQTFSYVFSDGDGWTNLFKFEVIINSALDGRDACFFTYFPGTSTMYLVRDDGAQYDSMVLGGSPPQLQNSQCIIYNAGTSATGSGTQFTLNVKITFKPVNSNPSKSFWGRRAMYMAALDSNGGNTGHRPMGVHEVPRPESVLPPQLQVLSVEPGQSNTAALASQVIRATFQASEGATFSAAQILLNTGYVDGANACFVTWTPGELHLVDDNGSSYQTIPLGGSVSEPNSQCTVYAAGSSAVVTGGYLILTVKVSATNSFAGPKLAYVATQGSAGNTGWQPGATWDIKLLPDSIAPLISQPLINVTSSSVKFEWLTNELADTQVFISGGPSSPFDSTLRTAHSASISSGLSAGTTYSYSAYSRDQFNNLAIRSGQFRTSDVSPFVVSTNELLCLPDTSGNCSHTRWEATGAAGLDGTNERWAHGWYVEERAASYISVWDGSKFSTPKELTALADLNILWNPDKKWWVYVTVNDGTIFYGRSTDAAGTSWLGPWAVFLRNSPPAANQWDYPSIAVNVSGDVLIGAVAFGPGVTPSAQGYGYKRFTASEAVGAPPTTPSPGLLGSTGYGPGGRIVAAGTKFHAFVPLLAGNNLPYGVDHWSSLDGVSWTPLGPIQTTTPFLTPKLDSLTSPAIESTFFAPVQIAAAGDPQANGRWVIAFQFLLDGYNTIGVCSEDRPCGYLTVDHAVFGDLFLPSVGISPGGTGSPTYWVSYHVIRGSAATPGYTVDLHSWVIPPLQQPIGKVLEERLNPKGFTARGNRCSDTCWAAGDFMTMGALFSTATTVNVSVPYFKPVWVPPANASAIDCDVDPLLKCGTEGNEMWQKFVRFPTSGSGPESRLPPGTDSQWTFLSSGAPFPAVGPPHSQVAPAPGSRTQGRASSSIRGAQ